MTTCLPSALCVIIAALVVASEARAADPSLDVVGAWGGPVNAVQIDGDIACVGSGRRLVVLDVSDINNFIELGSVVLGSTVQDLALRDGLAYVLTRDSPGDLAVVDVSRPSAPQVVWSTGSTPWASEFNEPVTIELRGNYAYIGDGGDSGASGGAGGDVYVASLSIPTVLAPAGFISTGGYLDDFIIHGDLMAVAYRTSSAPPMPILRIHDLAANPVQPPVLGWLDLSVAGATQGKVTDLAVAGNYVYALTVYEVGPEWLVSLAVIDISSPQTPVLVAPIAPSFGNNFSKHDIAAANGRLFVAAGANSGAPTAQGWANTEGLIIYDIAKPGGDPAAPAFIQSYKTHGSIFGVHPLGDIAWLSDAGEGLIALDVTNPLSPVRKDNFHSPAFLTGIDKLGDRLYVSDIWNGFTILNVAQPSAPHVLGVYQTPKTIPPFGKGEESNDAVDNLDIAVRDNFAYLAVGRAGIHAVNIANPANPIKAGGSPLLPEDQHATAIELDGSIAHLGIQFVCALCGGGLYSNYSLADVSSPIVLPLVSSPVSISKGPSTIVTHNGHSYLALSGLQIIDTLDPLNPELVYASSFPEARDLALSGDVLCAADWLPTDQGGGIKLYDELDPPDAPELEGYYPGGFSNAVAVQSNRAYLLTSTSLDSGDLFAFDISNPAQPQPLASETLVTAGGSANSVLADEPNIYVAGYDYGKPSGAVGLVILEISGCLDSAGDADFNCDGVVNGFDLAALLSQWTGSSFYTPCLPSIPADLSHDCRVNGGDLAILLGDWG